MERRYNFSVTCNHNFQCGSKCSAWFSATYNHVSVVIFIDHALYFVSIFWFFTQVREDRKFEIVVWWYVTVLTLLLLINRLTFYFLCKINTVAYLVFQNKRRHPELPKPHCFLRIFFAHLRFMQIVKYDNETVMTTSR